MLGRQRPAEWVIESLRNGHDRASFSCGNAALDRYLKEQARQDLRRACATTFVLAPEPGSPSIFGYYTLSSYGIDAGDAGGCGEEASPLSADPRHAARPSGR